MPHSHAVNLSVAHTRVRRTLRATGSAPACLADDAITVRVPVGAYPMAADNAHELTFAWSGPTLEHGRQRVGRLLEGRLDGIPEHSLQENGH